ncbi:MAG: T9SS type A sorting domain-containing protein, partial [Bacteroidota bacterium]
NTYNYPFGTTAGLLIPVNVTKTTATATDISIATRPTSASDNMPWASGVLHMFDPSLNQDGSDEAVIDRWWEITSSTSIVADVTFRYLGSENTLTAPYNTGSVGSQNWSASGWTPNNSNIGSTPAVTTAGTVGSHTATGITLGTTYTPWVLSSVTAPLPIELVSFRAECVENLPVLTWHTQSETNNDFFTVEKSNDAQQFVTDGIVSGAGTTTVPQNYTYALNSFAPEMPYYRLRQTDFNGNFTFSNTIMVNGCENENPDAVIVYFNNGMVNIDAYSSTSNALSATIYDVAGRLVYTGKQGISDQKSHISLNMNDFAEGIYIVNVHFSNGKLFSKKVPLH